MKRTKKYLEEENKWLWYHYHHIHAITKRYEFRQYDGNNNLISLVVGIIPKNAKRPKHPEEL